MKKINFVIFILSILCFAGCPALDEVETENRIIYATDTDTSVCAPVEVVVDSAGSTVVVSGTVVKDEACIQKVAELDSALEEALDDVQCDYNEYLGALYSNEILQRQMDEIIKKYDITRNKLWVICDEYCDQTTVCDCKEFFESPQTTDTDTSAE